MIFDNIMAVKSIKNLCLPIFLLSAVAVSQISGQTADSFKIQSKQLTKLIKADWNARDSEVKITDVKFEGCQVTIEKSTPVTTGPVVETGNDEKNELKIRPPVSKSLTVFDLKYLDSQNIKFEPDIYKSFDKLTVSTVNEDKEVFWYATGDLKKSPMISTKLVLFVKKKNSEKFGKLLSQMIKTCQK